MTSIRNYFSLHDLRRNRVTGDWGHPSSYKADWISKCQSFWRVMLGTLPVLVAVGWVSFLLYFYVTAAIYKKVRVFLILCCIGTVILQWSEGSRWMYKFPVIFVCKVWVLSYLLCPPLPSFIGQFYSKHFKLFGLLWLIDSLDRVLRRIGNI